MLQYSLTAVLAFMMLSAVYGKNAELPLTAHWDFTKGSIHSTDSRYKMRFRGNSEIIGENKERFLKPGMTSGTEPSGIESVSSSENLSPSGSFRIEAEVCFDSPSSNRSQMFLYDTKNITYPSKVPAHNMGILFMVVRNIKNNTFTLFLSCGMGQKSILAQTPPRKMEFGKKYVCGWNCCC